MSKAQLKKAMANMDRESIAEMVAELYDARPEAKEYLEFWINPDIRKEFEKYKTKLHRLFFSPSGKARKRPTATSLKQLVKYFSTLCFDPELVAQLHIYICECDVDWLKARRNPHVGIISVRNDLANARQYIESAGLEDRYGIKLERIEEQLEQIEQTPPEPKRGRRGWRKYLL